MVENSEWVIVCIVSILFVVVSNRLRVMRLVLSVVLSFIIRWNIVVVEIFF